MNEPLYECDRCGYDLTSVPATEAGVTCPECGTHHEAPPYALAPWPAWPWLALRLVGPGAVLLTIVVLLSRVPGARNLLLTGWPFLLATWVMFALAAPLYEGAELARRHALVPDRFARRWTLRAIGLGANLALTALTVWALWLLR